MGVEARVALYAPDEEPAIDAARAAFARIDELDRELSDYKPDSELSRLGARSGGPAIEVGDDLYRVLDASIAVSRASGGAFDVTVGPLVSLWREARKTRELPSGERIDAARASVGWESIELDARHRTVRLAKPDMRLDVGGIGKGFACDEALKVLQAHAIDRAFVALSGDIRFGAPPPGRKGWKVTATSGDRAASAEQLTLANCAVSTSGDTEQFVEIGGERYSHIIDPHTGEALTSRIRVTVMARDGTTADALATAASVLGPDEGIDFVTRFDGTEAMIETINPSGILLRTTRGFQSRRGSSVRMPGDR
jgi:thiamine biosynthesis lipoprotein